MNTHSLRLELSRAPVKKRCCQASELQGLLLAIGQWRLPGGGVRELELSTGSQAVLSRVLALCERLFAFSPEVYKIARTQPRRHTEYRVCFGAEKTAQIEALLGLPEAGLEPASTCCEAAFLRGCFLGAGYLSNPQKEYNLEFVLSAAAAKRVQGLLFQQGYLPLCRQRGEASVVALKDFQHLCALVGFMGGRQTLLELESVRVEKQVREKINRSMNCENANLDKTARSSANQTEAILLLQREGRLQNLQPALQILAEARLSHPQAPLSELSQLLGWPRSVIASRFAALQKEAAGEPNE